VACALAATTHLAGPFDESSARWRSQQ